MNDRVRLELYLTHRAELVDYAHRIVRDRARAEDVVQDAWLRVVAAEREKPLGRPLGYLYRVVRNLAIDGYRSQRREAARGGDDLSMVAETVADAAPSPEAAAIARHELRQVLACLDDLPERTRKAVTLYKFEGLKLREAAEQMGISIALANKLVLDGVQYCAERIARRP